MFYQSRWIPTRAGMTELSADGFSTVIPAHAGIQCLCILLNISFNLIPMLFQPGAPRSRFAFTHQHGESIF